MSKISGYVVLMVSLFLLAACNQEKDNSMLWGETEYYEDFLLCDYEPVIMTKTICFEQNEDAEGRVHDTKFGLFKKEENGSFSPVKDDVVLYKDGEECKDNVLVVKPEDKEVKLGIEFTPDAAEGVHKWFLKVLDNGGYDRINEFSTEEESLPLLFEWKAEKNVITNPLKLGMNIFLLVILTLLFIWLVILRPQAYPSIKARKLYIQYEKEGKMVPIKLTGVYKVICTNRPRSQGFFERWFKGKIVYEKNTYWNLGDIEIVAKDKNSVKVKLVSKYTMLPNVVTNRQPVEIKYVDDKTNIVTFKVQ